MTKDKVTPLRAEIDMQVKEKVISEIDGGTEVSRALKLLAELKVLLLADVGWQGGLNPDNRRRAWRMVAEIGILLMEKDHDD